MRERDKEGKFLSARASKEYTCPMCGKVFNRQRSNINTKTDNYCSQACFGLGRKKQILKENIKNFVGKRFGKLEVIEVCNDEKKRAYFFVCKCDCGKVTKASKYHIINGRIKSCGCGHKDDVTRLHTPEAKEKAVHTIYERETPNKNNLSTGVKNVLLTPSGTYQVIFAAKKRRIRLGTYKTFR